ncbi:uncharacterized protein TNCV_4068311 [Trichonephila clavipes]|nr:uncharacterized protein TNCV_4068311 [Trichonephila clavipes]
MSRCPDQVDSLKRNPQCLSPQASLILIFRPTPVGMKGGKNDCDAERDRRERRDSGFTGEKPCFSVNVEANRLMDNRGKSQLIAREPEQEARDYDHVRFLLLKRFKMTPEKFRQLFVTHQKSSDKTWRDFYQEVQTFFNRWIEGLDVKIFDKLRDLMIADQMKKRSPVEFKERHLDEWPSINCPVELANEDVRRT